MAQNERSKDILYALEGSPQRCSPDLHRELKGIPNLFRLLRQLREMVVDNRHGAGVDLLAMLEEKYTERQAFMLGRAACYLARRRLDYWGIKDPAKEWWCSYCKNVLPIEKFPQWRTSLCEDCAERKRRHRKRSQDEIERRKTYAESRAGDTKPRDYEESRHASAT